MAGTERSDDDLMKELTLRKPEALRVLYRRYGRLVYGLALQILNDPSSAEEVTQDVFHKVWEQAGTYDRKKAKVSTWLGRIARNRAIDRWRQKGAVLTAESPGVSWSEDHTAEFWRDEESRRVRSALAALPDPQKKVLSLAFFHGRSHREISEQLGEPLGTVKSRIRDAMIKLRGRLEEGGAE